MKYHFMLSLLVGYLLVCPASAQDYYEVSINLNLRSGPGTSHPVVASIPQREKVKFVQKENDTWWKVEHQGQDGYVASKYLKEESSHPNSNSSQWSDSGSAATKGKTSSSTSSSSGARRSKHSRSSASAGGSSYTWGIGLRLGDPTGLSVKRFLGNRSWEFNFGRTAYWSYDPEWAFNRYDDFNDYEYLDGRLRSALSFQASEKL